MVADPQGQILDSKEYLSPIITPFEAMLAFSPDSEWEERRYRLDFDGVLVSGTVGISIVQPFAAGSTTNCNRILLARTMLRCMVCFAAESQIPPVVSCPLPRPLGIVC